MNLYMFPEQFKIITGPVYDYRIHLPFFTLLNDELFRMLSHSCCDGHQV